MTWNCPPNWPAPPVGWSPPIGWKPDPAWGAAPAGWDFESAESAAATPPRQGMRRSNVMALSVVLRSRLGQLVLVGAVAFAIGSATGSSGAGDAESRAASAEQRASSAEAAQVSAEAARSSALADLATADTRAQATAQASVVGREATVKQKEAAVALREKAAGVAEATAAANSFAGDGDFLVGSDIQPGTFKSDGGDACYWARHDKANAILDNHLGAGPTVVVVLPGDFSLEVAHCAQFHKTG